MSAREPLRPERAGRRVEAAQTKLERRDPLWPAQLTTLIAIALGLTLPDELTIGPSWLLPTCETVLFVGIVASTPRRPEHDERRRRALRIALVALVSAANVVSLVLLSKQLLDGGNADGRKLLIAGAVLWMTAVLLFALWFWELDRGGPIQRSENPDAPAGFLFPQMSDPDWVPPDWRPGLGDYLYLSLTNAASFAPGDTVPLTETAKVVMAVQALASLITVAIVLAYAVNNLS